MAPPSKLAVATSSVLRLVKEEASYHKEMAQQEARIKKLEENPSAQELEIRQKLKLVRPGETSFILPDSPKTETAKPEAPKIDAPKPDDATKPDAPPEPK